jgi:hypothetical protein
LARAAPDGNVWVPSHPEVQMAARFAILLASLWFPVPCASAADNEVTGKITLNDKPLQEGKVTFHLPNDQFIGAKIKPDGTYLIDRVPAGTFKVTIEGKGVPPKYATEEASEIKVTIKKGGEFNFDLKSR